MLLNSKFNDFKNGKGLWKFNNPLLKQKEYLGKINDVIKKTKKQYGLIIYRKDSLDEIHASRSDIQFTINDQLFLETLLMKIRAKTISFASYFRKKQ